MPCEDVIECLSFFVVQLRQASRACIAQGVDTANRLVAGIRYDRQLAEFTQVRVGGHPLEHGIELVERLGNYRP